MALSVYHTASAEETAQLAAKFSETLVGGEVLAFLGDLGAGKTCFITGMSEGLGYPGDVNSPTFAIMNEYRGGRLTVFHFDMYRVSGWDDLETTGYFDALESGGVVAVEWSENIAAALPEHTITVTITKGEGDERTVTVKDPR